VSLAFSATDAAGGICGGEPQGDGLEVFVSPRGFLLGIHVVIAGEDRRDIDAFRAGHAVFTARAADLGVFVDVAADPVDHGKLRIPKRSGLSGGGDAAVFLEHLKRIHAG